MSQRRRRRNLATAAVVFFGLAITAVLALAAEAAHEDNEDRLLSQRTEEVAAILTIAVPSIEGPLATTAELVDESGDVELFDQVMGTQVGPGRRFASAALMPADGAQPLATIGERPRLLQRGSDDIERFVDGSVSAGAMSVLDLIDDDQSRIGYGYSLPDGEGQYVVYAEQALPSDRTQSIPDDTAFADLNFALYLDTDEGSPTLVLGSTDELPLEGRQAEQSTPYGDGSLLLVVAPTDDLGGALLAALPWIVLAAGTAMTVGTALLAARLHRGRRRAEALAGEVTDLYDEQRAAALTLQQSLLPREIPTIEGLEVAVRYSPGVAGTEVGGDWYEVVDLGSKTVLVVGDVSGRGLMAASVMAAVRHSIRAFASQGDAPDAILQKASYPDAIDLGSHFATVLCAVLDRADGTLTVATAGHPPPVVIDSGRAQFVEVPVGRPIGADTGPPYESSTTRLRPGTSVLLYTDGLFERRGEAIDVSLERLRIAANRTAGLDEVVEAVFDEMGAGTVADDTAILAVRWTP